MVYFLLIATQSAATPVVVTAPSPIIARNKSIVAKSYPRSSLARGEEGSVVLRLDVNRGGGIDGCQIVVSSGYTALDEASCTVGLNATSEPLRNAAGRRTAGTRDVLIEWRLPTEAVRQSQQPAYTADASTFEKIICRRAVKIGTLAVTSKVCLSKSDWSRQLAYSQSTARGLQSETGQ